MSRIGNKIIPIPENVTVELGKGVVNVKGPKGSLTVNIPEPEYITVEVKDGHVHVLRANDEKHTKQCHGTTRALVHNAIIGVSEGFKKNLEIIGIGYRAEVKGGNIVLHVGYSHDVTIKPEPGVTITVTDSTKVCVEGIDKDDVGQTASLIRGVREPEPYNGKGIKYVSEHILRKEGKRNIAKK